MFFFRMAIKQFFKILIDIKGSSSKTRVDVVGVGDAEFVLILKAKEDSFVFNERKLSE
jgi:hypothetical protein